MSWQGSRSGSCSVGVGHQLAGMLPCFLVDTAIEQDWQSPLRALPSSQEWRRSCSDCWRDRRTGFLIQQCDPTEARGTGMLEQLCICNGGPVLWYPLTPGLPMVLPRYKSEMGQREME